MTYVHLFLAWLDSALLCSIVVLWFGKRFKLERNHLVFAALPLFLVLLVPVRGLSLFMYAWSIIGDLSMTSKTYLIAWLLYRLGGPVVTDMKEIRSVMRAISIVGLVFYPLSLGISQLDPYATGYSASIPIILTVVLAAYGLRKGFYVLTTAMLLALWGYLLGLMVSNNLFDYLLDPILFLYALGFTCVTLVRKPRAKNTAGRTT